MLAGVGIAIFLVIVISSLPLWLAVRIMGGDAGFLKVFFVNVGLGILGLVLGSFFGNLGILSLVVNIVVYMSAFDLSFFKALLAMILSVVFAVVMIVGALLLLGIGAGSMLEQIGI